jgi:hypothetical protein
MGKFLGSNLSLDHIFWVVMEWGKKEIMDGSCMGGQLRWLAAAWVGSCNYRKAAMINHIQFSLPPKFQSAVTKCRQNNFDFNL